MNRYQQRGRALGSDVVLTIIASTESNTQFIFQELWANINGFEKRFSRFLEDSELSIFNRNAGSLNKISDKFIKILEACKQQSKRTNGLYNPFSLPALQKSGYKGSWPTIDKFSTSLDFSKRESNFDIDELIISEGRAKIPKNSALDLGGIGKGYLLDQLANLLDSKSIENYWISLGGDIICHGQDLENKHWIIGVSGIDDDSDPIVFIKNESRSKLAIATSGTIKRHGADWHHIIDPRTSNSAVSDVLSSTVIGESATATDIDAKAMIIIGSKNCKHYIDKHQILGALLQISDNSKYKIIKYGEIK